MCFRLRFLLFLTYCFSSLAKTAGQATRVQLNNGAVVIGKQSKTAANTQYISFKGIPYAHPPVGDLRFRPPKPYDGTYHGVTIHALEDANICVQSDFIPTSPIKGVEDCLFLNIYKPVISSSTPLPVLVWVHGGSYIIGDSTYNSYGPDFFMDRKNVLFVSFNHRLGVFGYLSTEDSAAYGNYGILDQIEALRFVKKHISAFGGNPNSVTLFGESAGSVGISYMLQTPLAQDLFHKVIMQSGTTLSSVALTRNARATAYTIGVALGANMLSTQNLVDDLRKANYLNLQKAASAAVLLTLVQHGVLNGLPFGPVLEQVHPNAIITERSYELLRTGAVKRVPVIVGYNSYEAVFLQDFFAVGKPYLLLFDLDPSRFVPADMNVRDQGNKATAGQLIKNYYFGHVPVVLSDRQFMQYMSDDLFVRSSRKYVEMFGSLAPTYFYVFSFDSKLGNRGRSIPGVGHADELAYFFLQSDRNYSNLSPSERLTITRLTKLWTNFAVTGNPTPTVDPTFNSQKWPKVTTQGSGNAVYFDIGTNCVVKTNPQKQTIDGWEYLYNRYGNPPYDTY